MNQQLDSLFKSKLGHHAIPPAMEAWTRVESELNKSAKKMVWLKVAAGVALFAVASLLLVNLTGTEEPVIAQQTSEPERNSVEITAKIPSGADPVVHEATKSARKKMLPEPPAKVFQPIAAIELPVEINEHTTPAPNNEETITQPATGLVIVLTAEEIHSKYLLKPEEIGATPEHKKSSRLQKLAGLAHNLSNEDILGDLRDRKNELFAFNFLDNKKDKKN
ncbi:MAG: hypothetical protein HRU69_08475 [Flammeovirgaceae bacterium]|nr:MAG: hypothetical protein HRU69_08475 [Flammeovirgaceae bacterium]